MAGTISVDVSVQAANGVWEFPFSRSFVIDQTNPGASAPKLELTTSEEAVPVADLTSPGLVVIWNIGESGTVEYGPDSGGTMAPLGQIPPGECRLVDLKSGVTLKAKAVSGTATVWIVVFDR